MRLRCRWVGGGSALEIATDSLAGWTCAAARLRGSQLSRPALPLCFSAMRWPELGGGGTRNDAFIGAFAMLLRRRIAAASLRLRPGALPPPQ
ncbi:hypothetical protein ANO11243_015560 [Dothideomycetidae sp. 11243]|nr:hypothetical protein ANO11243_015560 [fungal sp. No.11243]